MSDIDEDARRTDRLGQASSIETVPESMPELVSPLRPPVAGGGMSGIIDAHAHIWNRASGDYAWITPEFALIDRDFGLDEFSVERMSCGVDRVILVQAADTAGDTDRMLAEAAAHPEVAGIVAWLPLGGPELVVELGRRVQTGKVVGVRALIHNMADSQWVLGDVVAVGLDSIAAMGLPFDVVTAGPESLALVPKLAARHPNLRIIVDHLGKPPIGGDSASLNRWRELLHAAARPVNVAAKLSGLASSVGSADSWSVETLRPVIDTALDAFGPERLMFGGDWPLCNLAGGYSRTFEGVHAALDAGRDELDHIYRQTATTWYRLDERH